MPFIRRPRSFAALVSTRAASPMLAVPTHPPCSGEPGVLLLARTRKTPERCACVPLFPMYYVSLKSFLRCNAGGIIKRNVSGLHSTFTPWKPPCPLGERGASPLACSRRAPHPRRHPWYLTFMGLHFGGGLHTALISFAELGSLVSDRDA